MAILKRRPVTWDRCRSLKIRALVKGPRKALQIKALRGKVTSEGAIRLYLHLFCAKNQFSTIPACNGAGSQVKQVKQEKEKIAEQTLGIKVWIY